MTDAMRIAREFVEQHPEGCRFYENLPHGDAMDVCRALLASAEGSALTPRDAVNRELLEALRWAVPLAEIALEDCRVGRLKAGHSDISYMNRNGESWVGLYQSEYDQLMFAKDVLSKDRGEARPSPSLSGRG